MIEAAAGLVHASMICDQLVSVRGREMSLIKIGNHAKVVFF
jgi:hypothetical protein